MKKAGNKDQKETLYTRNGFRDRKHYLNSLARQFKMLRSDVYMLADMLGPSEDFDGLVVALEDYKEF